MPDPTASFETSSSSAFSATVAPGVSTSSAASSSFEASTKRGNIATEATSRSEFESDSGDLINGRYRR